MDQERRVQVVLGEGERTDGLLRFVLEAEGFDIVGLASNDEELSRIVRGARPEVVVLDGGISATAALDAKGSVQGAALVVVWPDGVSAVLADERVDPHMAIEDLGDAVRRAAHRVELQEEPIRVPEAAEPIPAIRIDASPVVERVPPQPRRPRRGRRAQLLVAATTWLLVITALTAIAAAVPNALGLLSRHGDGRPSSGSRVDRPVDEGLERSEPADPADDGQPAACDAAVTRGNGADRSEGRGNSDPVRAQGCPPDREKTGGDKEKGGGRPDDPGSQGNGGGSGGSSGNGGGDGAGSDGAAEAGGGGSDQGNTGDGEEHGSAGGGEKLEEHGRAGEGGRSTEHA